MDKKMFRVEERTPFSESLIWELNRSYYKEEGPKAWSQGTVPHHLTSNALVGKTYAELIFAFLQDLAQQQQIGETVYILELGAGHGKLAYHILKHLTPLVDQNDLPFPPFCYVLSDIAEDNLSSFKNHPQFQPYFEQNLLDVAYFDGTKSTEINLWKAGLQIKAGSLKNALLVIANYFFDTIPTDLFYLKNKKISKCLISLETVEDPTDMKVGSLLKNIQADFEHVPLEGPAYQDPVLNEILEAYQDELFDTYLFFPEAGLKCINNLKKLSPHGLMLLSMDKGYHQLHELENQQSPEIIIHGSFSVWVNYHAFQKFCEHGRGAAFFPSYSTFHLELGCMLFVEDPQEFLETKLAYQRYVEDYGPDDFNSLKKFTYQQMDKMALRDLLGILRLGRYDSILFKNMLPRIKQLSKRITFAERHRLEQSMHRIWNMYFSLNEAFDLAFELGGIFYDLGFYQEALVYFKHSKSLHGNKADVYYNLALCYYQLRQDDYFIEILEIAKKEYPKYPKFQYLDTLDLNA